MQGIQNKNPSTSWERPSRWQRLRYEDEKKVLGVLSVKKGKFLTVIAKETNLKPFRVGKLLNILRKRRKVDFTKVKVTDKHYAYTWRRL